MIDRLFIWLLKRECRKIDQWERFIINTAGIDFYVSISMQSDGYEYGRVK